MLANQRSEYIPLTMALAVKLLRDIGFVEKINRICRDAIDDERCPVVKPGHVALAFVACMFSEMRVPLTHVTERLKNIDLDQLLGLEGVKPNHINASNIGRMLQAVGKNKELEEVFSQSAMEMLAIMPSMIRRIIADTTSCSFSGEYDFDIKDLSKKDQEEMLKIVRGFSKDHRPEDNQVVIGQMVQEDGAPLFTKVMDGNTSDVEWNEIAIEWVAKMVAKGFKGIFSADSKLCTKDLVMSMVESGILFVTRMPANFDNKLESRCILRAYEEDNWTEIGQVGIGKNVSSYKAVCLEIDVFDINMRAIVAESTALKDKTVRHLEKHFDKLSEAAEKISSKKPKTKEEAKKLIDTYLSQNATPLYDVKASIVEVPFEKWPKGRRGPNTVPTIDYNIRIEAPTPTRNEEAIETHMKQESCIVLLTNVPERTAGQEDDDPVNEIGEADYSNGLTSREIIKVYKGQMKVENSFKLYKGPALASVAYINNPTRVKGLHMLISFALLTRAAIQARLRSGLEKYKQEHEGESPRLGWNDRPLEYPTYKLFFEHTINAYVCQNELDIWYVDCPVSDEDRILGLLSLLEVTTMGDLLIDNPKGLCSS
jgi:transposase